MSELTIFAYESSAVRTVMQNGEPWFAATDIAKILGYRNAPDMVRNLEDDEKGTQIVRTLGGDQELSVVSESGMYAAIFKSRREEAKKFRKWVTSEVLPTIRKTGSYHAAGAVPPAPTFSTSNLSHGADLAVAADRTFRSFMRAARVAGLRGGRALQIANSQTLARTGIDMLAELGMDLASPLDQAGCRHLNDSGVGEFGAAWVDGRLPLPATICRSAELYSAYRHWRGMDFACPINRFTEYMEKAQRTVRKRHVSANFADKDIAVRCFVVGNPFALVQPGGMSRHAAREIDQFSAALAEWQGAVG